MSDAKKYRLLAEVDRASPVKQLSGLALLIACSWMTEAVAQAVPNAGRLLQDSTQRMERPSVSEPTLKGKPVDSAPSSKTTVEGPKFRLSSVRFAGNTVFSSQRLAAFFQDNIGQDVSLPQLKLSAAQITEQYRAQGYFLAQAIIPSQEIVDGVIEVSVIEGRLGKVRFAKAEDVLIDVRVIQKYLAALEVGSPLTEKLLERTMLLLSDLPGASFQSTLEQGEEPGTVDLIIEAKAGRRIDAQLELDNFGLESSGEYRAGGAVRVANPFGRGDNLDVRVLATSAAHTLFGRASYELPLDGLGTRMGVGFSSLGYSLGAPFDALGAKGFARVLDISASRPFVRSRATTLLGNFQLQRKAVEDRYDSVGFSSTRDINEALAGLTYESRDQVFGGGYVNFNTTLTIGDVQINSADALALDEGANGRNTQGSFVKLNYSASRLQALGGQWSLFGVVSGQLANKNLDNAERIAFGGPRAVRAYSSGALVADEGVLATAELRYSVNPEISLSAFYDSAWATVNHSPIVSVLENRVNIQGYGIGVFWGKPKNFQIQCSLAWRATDPIPGDATDRSPRLYVRFAKYL